jgi:hypothetical protein
MSVARGNVHPVAEKVPSAYHYVADVNPDAEIDALVSGKTGVRFGQGSLRLRRVLHRVNGASELRKYTVARRVCYPAPSGPCVPVRSKN